MAPRMRSGLVGIAATILWGNAAGARKKITRRQSAKYLAGVPLYHAEEHARADQWMVSFGPEATDETLEAYCAQNGPCAAMGHPSEGGIPYVLVKGSEKALESGIAAHQSKIAFIEQDADAQDFVEAGSASSAAKYVPWGLKAIGGPSSRSKGSGVNVYVLDSGVRVTHQDFGGRAIPLYDATFSPPKVCDSTDTSCAKDQRGHGTHVAGSVGGTKWGVAPAATLFAMQRGSSFSDGFGCIDWLVQNRKKPAVLQMSWGTGSRSEVAAAAVDAAVDAGITVTVAGGNSNEDACMWTFAGIPNAIAVGSTDSNMARSSFSNFGPCINILAPGSNIWSADYKSNTGEAVRSGTSMASPHVAGGAALILQANPEFSPAEVLQELVANSAKNVISDAKSDNFFLRVSSESYSPAPPAGDCPWHGCVWGCGGEKCEFCDRCQ